MIITQYFLLDTTDINHDAEITECDKQHKLAVPCCGLGYALSNDGRKKLVKVCQKDKTWQSSVSMDKEIGSVLKIIDKKDIFAYKQSMIKNAEWSNHFFVEKV